MIRTTAAGVLIALITLSGTPVAASATDDVRAAMLKFAALSSYELSFGAGARRAVIDLVKPDAMHMTAGPYEMIRIGTTTYLKQGPRGWTKMPTTAGYAPMLMADNLRKFAHDANAIAATDLGMKSVDGETLHAYRVKPKDSSASILYIAGDGLPHRFDSGGRPDNVVHVSKFNAIGPIRPPV